MTDLYIATPTQADYDALMRLAESAGYKVYYEPLKQLSSENRKIETISHITNIKAIWSVKPEYLDVFSKEKLNTGDVIKDWVLSDGVIILLENVGFALGFEEVYKALAAEYKPKESEEVMEHKVVPLPKFMCDYLDKRDLDRNPLPIIGAIEFDALKEPAEVTE